MGSFDALEENHSKNSEYELGPVAALALKNPKNMGGL